MKGIWLPDTAQEKSRSGVVLDAGPGTLNEHGVREEVPVKKGDVVLFTKYAGHQHREVGDDMMFLSPEEILAVVVIECPEDEAVVADLDRFRRAVQELFDKPRPALHKKATLADLEQSLKEEPIDWPMDEPTSRSADFKVLDLGDGDD